MSQRQRLGIVLALNASMIAAAVIVGFTANSLSVLAAGGDYVADSVAVLLGIIAVTIRDRADGRSRAPTIVALINASALLVVTALVLIEAVRRLIHGTPEVHGLPVLIVSSVGAMVLVIGALVLGRDAGREDLHMRSVLLDTVSDAVTSAAVAITGGIIFFADGLYWLDAVVAIAISVVVGAGALRLLRDVVQALRRETAPEGPAAR